MWKTGLLATVALPVALVSAATPQSRPGPSQAALDTLAREMGYGFAILDNHPDHCPSGGTACFRATITLTMPEVLPPDLASGGFTLTYNFVAPLIEAQSEMFADKLVNGDLHRLTVKPGARLEPGKRYVITLWGEGHFFSAYYPMPNAFLSADGLEPRTIEAAKAAVDPETGIEYLPFVAPMTDESKLAAADDNDATQWLTPERAYDLYAAWGQAQGQPDFAIIPKPVRETRLDGDPIDVTGGLTLKLYGVTANDVGPALDYLKAAGVGNFTSGPMLSVTVRPGSDIAAEGYHLQVEDGAIDITASSPAGAAYALRSLGQETAYEKGSLRPMAIDDAPAYPYRGLHIDLARNFHSKAELLKLIDAMAAYKLNKLHLHLADDEGWRLAIKGLPELTEIGSRRCGDPSEMTCLAPQLGAGPTGTGPQNGYLSDADYIEIVRAAAARHIEVIPSLDMPGHSRAAIRSMEVRYKQLMDAGEPEQAAAYRLVEPGDTTRYRSIQNYDDNTLNVCLPQTYRFFGTTLDAVIALHKAAGVPLNIFHIGADETAGAWTESPACKALMARTGMKADQLGAYFIERVAKMIADRGIKVAGWSDGLSHTDPAKMPEHVQSGIWGGLFTGAVAETHEQSNRGWDTVLSIPDFDYFDMPYAPDPNERGYDWATRGIDTRQVFAFMPGNLAANAAIMKDITAHPQTLDDATPLEPGRLIEGIQAQLWSETVRGDAAVDYMLFPRLLAFAERAWRKPEWEPAYQPGASYSYQDPRVDRAAIDSAWRNFAGRMSAQFPLLDKAGIRYRLAPPGARVIDGQLYAVSEFPGLAIAYRQGDGAWQVYTGPTPVSGPVSLRTVAPDGRPGRTVSIR
ncbi:family 20 glycosylhydrolase [Sphingosinithalassobacter portus]|uniref:family 20 glycosylhydrolase n=1 Tax=Stakelama portus TaxID=2676234 RepID=UPI000D6E6631|nr:family 20 glycosylhydrolase [Sphingosinithalassobacter portus]